MLNMGRSQKSKRVSWASDLNLCQVKLFLSEESPSQVGHGTQDHLQPKVVWPARFGAMGSDDNLPPGFEGMQQPVNHWNAKLLQAPVIKWKCPPRFKVNPAWQVVAGEESKELEAETLRQAKVLEAIYPRILAIPPNASEPTDVENTNYNDQNTLLVPLTPIEEEDGALDNTSFGSTFNPITSQPQNVTHVATSYQGSSSMNPKANTTAPSSSLDPNILANLQVALSPYMSTPNQGNLIDQELLIKILSNPNMVEQLVKKQGASSSSQDMPSHNIPVSGTQAFVSRHIPSSSGVHNRASLSTQNAASSSISSMPMPMSATHSMSSAHFVPNLRSQPPPGSFDPTNISRQEHVTSSWAGANLPFNPQSRIGSSTIPPSVRPNMPEVSAPSSSIGMTKDINYYKSLIQQHGGERRETTTLYPPHQGQQTSFGGTNQEVGNVMRSRESKPKINKPCMYFNTPRGCRNGANCAFQHDTTVQQQRVGSGSEVPNAKRMKMDREITG